MSNTKQKNGKIEFLRFVFCICVVFFHYYKYIMDKSPAKGIDFRFFPNGAIAVEFFFLVSGYLMGMSIYKSIHNTALSHNDRVVSKDYVSFISKKIFSIFPYHAVGFVIVLATASLKDIGNWLGIAKDIVKSIPCFFLLDMSGIKPSNPNLVEWYLSAMLICMAILYPFVRKYYYRFTRYWAPVIGIMLLGSIIIQNSKLVGDVHGLMFGFVYWGVVRAFAEICLGLFAFELCRFMDKLEIGKVGRMLLTIIEICMFAASMLFIMMTFEANLQIVCFFAIFVLVLLCFSNITYGNRLFNNKLFYLLGSLSLPIYLCHYAGIHLLQLNQFKEFSEVQKLIIYVLTATVSTIIVKLIGKQIYKIKTVKKIMQKVI